MADFKVGDRVIMNYYGREPERLCEIYKLRGRGESIILRFLDVVEGWPGHEGDGSSTEKVGHWFVSDFSSVRPAPVLSPFEAEVQRYIDRELQR
jgi:hypothetical protein